MGGVVTAPRTTSQSNPGPPASAQSSPVEKTVMSVDETETSSYAYSTPETPAESFEQMLQGYARFRDGKMSRLQSKLKAGPCVRCCTVSYCGMLLSH